MPSLFLSDLNPGANGFSSSGFRAQTSRSFFREITCISVSRLELPNYSSQFAKINASVIEIRPMERVFCSFTVDDRKARGRCVGREIDGTGDGQPGSEFIATISAARVTTGGLSLARRPRQSASPKTRPLSCSLVASLWAGTKRRSQNGKGRRHAGK